MNIMNLNTLKSLLETDKIMRSKYDGFVKFNDGSKMEPYPHPLSDNHVAIIV